MLNRSKAEAEDFIRESQGKISQKEMAVSLGVTPARVSQMVKEMKGPSTSIESGDQVTAPEAA